MRLPACIGRKEVLAVTLVIAIITQTALIGLSIYTAVDLKITSGDCSSVSIGVFCILLC